MIAAGDGADETYPLKPQRGSSHSWALEAAAALPGPLDVLDVGAGPGHVARALRARRRDVRVWAVEPDPASARALEGSVEAVHAALDGVTRDGFDLALLLDVLEHVQDPAALLADVAARVRPGGALLVSVPNVAHWSVRASLLAGRFDYAPRGILDRTHLRFFTRRTFRSLLAGAGLEVLAEDASIAPVEQVLGTVDAVAPWALGRGLRQAAARTLPGLLAYQLLAHARRR